MYAADSILVVLPAQPAGGLRANAAELLGGASQAGTPVALVIGAADATDDLAAQAATLGATAVLTSTSDTLNDVAIADATVAAMNEVNPHAVLLANTADGRDAAARVSVRT